MQKGKNKDQIMAKVQRSNYLPYLQQYLDTQSDEDGVVLEVACGICQERKLDISKSARKFTPSSEPAAEHLERHRHFISYLKHGLERTVALPCGHVFGDRCISDLLAQGTDLGCPSCGFKMSYQGCGHIIRPAPVPVDGYEPIRDLFPLTMPEGGNDPQNCTECRWKQIRSNIRYALSDECILCRRRNSSHIPLDLAEHRKHRERHINVQVRQALDEMVALVWPEFITRETELSAVKAATDNEHRQIQVSLLNAMVLSELDETLWYRTKASKTTSNLTKEQQRKHSRAVASIEQCLLGWFVNFPRQLRRTW
ncbi:hypothetical protein F4677DRAFT_223809 [Hypoxylon crocopeplum]|nr:hypothetical protein F4677DRAFT_223809 [Hypoxylon crocopeplum]